MVPFRCIYPCRKVFTEEKDLVRHYRQRPSCKIAWDIRLKQAAETAARNAAIEVRNDTMALANEDLAIEMDGWNSIDDGGVQNETNNDTYEGNIASLGLPTVSNGMTAASSGDQPGGDSNPDAVPEFENYMFGSGGNGHESEERINPCLEEEDGDAEESGPSDVPPMEILIEELGGVLENVQIDSEGDEDSDPSEIVSFTRAGEIKSCTKPHFESVLGEEEWSPFHPFAGAAEFQLAKWLNDLPLTKVDSFLQLDWVCGLVV